MNWLYALAQPFVWHPARALLVALGWLLLALTLPSTERRPLFITAVAWSVFALLELEAWRERANIRVDLLVTWPALCLLTIGCLIITRFASALAKRLEARPPAVATPDPGIGELREELDAMQERLDFLERALVAQQNQSRALPAKGE